MISIPCSSCNSSSGWLHGYSDENGKLCWICEKCFREQEQKVDQPHKAQINKLKLRSK